LSDENLIHEAKKNTKWVSIANAISLLLNFVITLWVASYLGPEEFGHFEYALGIVTLILPVCSLGLQSVVAKEIIIGEESEEVIMSVVLMLRTIASIICWLITSIIIFNLNVDFELRIGAWVASTMLLLTAPESFKAYYEAKNKTQAQGKVAIIKGLVDGISKSVLVLLKAPLMLFLFIPFVVRLASSIALYVFYKRIGGTLTQVRLSWPLVKKLLVKGSPLVLSGFFSAVYLKIDRIMLGAYGHNVSLGNYGVASRISEGYLFIPMAIVTSAIPLLMSLKGAHDDKYKKMLQGGYDLLFVVSVCISFGVFAIVWIFNGYLIEAGYSQVLTILALHLGGTVFLSMRSLTSKWLIIENLTIFSIVSHASGALINVLFNLVLIPIYKGHGAAFATLIAYAFAGWISFALFKRTRPQFFSIAKSLITPLRPQDLRAIIGVLKSNKI